MREMPTFSTNKLTVVVWPDEVIDQLGHDARSRYVEAYWLGILGPSTTWLLRHIANELEQNPSGFVMNLSDTAMLFGLSAAGRHSPFLRALGRLVKFDLAQLQGPEILAVRPKVPSLSRRHLARLPHTLQQKHDYWQKQQLAITSSGTRSKTPVHSDR